MAKTFELTIEDRPFDRHKPDLGDTPCLILKITDCQGYHVGESALPLSALEYALNNLKRK